MALAAAVLLMSLTCMEAQIGFAPTYLSGKKIYCCYVGFNYWACPEQTWGVVRGKWKPPSPNPGSATAVEVGAYRWFEFNVENS